MTTSCVSKYTPPQLVPIRSYIKGTDKFPIQKCTIFRKFKEIGGIARRCTFVRRTIDAADLSRL